MDGPEFETRKQDFTGLKPESVRTLFKCWRNDRLMTGNRLVYISIFLSAVTLSPDAYAAFSPEFKSCISTGLAAQGSDPAMADCYRDEIKRQEALLEQAFQAKM